MRVWAKGGRGVHMILRPYRMFGRLKVLSIKVVVGNYSILNSTNQFGAYHVIENNFLVDSYVGQKGD